MRREGTAVTALRRRLPLACLLAATVPLSGCVAMVAASALQYAVKGAQPAAVPNGELKPQAEQQCKDQASRYGTVRIIDVQQASPSKIIVWGTIDEANRRLSFTCDFGTKINGFKMRPIKATPTGAPG
jgi:hypothetical protein